jgi:dipeptidyl aminopeptidase/acylaminoacyl peptidase
MVDHTTPRKLTSGPGGIASHFGSVSYDWAPDGRFLVYLSQPEPHSGSRFRCTVKALEMPKGTERVVLGEPKAYFEPRFSPDSSRIGVGMSRGEEPFFNPNSFFVVPSKGGSLEDVAVGIDRSLYGRWMPDGQSVLLTGPDETRSSMWYQMLGGTPKKLNLGRVHASDFSVSSNGRIVIVGTEPDQPEEVYLLASAESQPVRLSDFNSVLHSRRFGRAETIRWNGPDGFTENGVLIYPPEFKPGSRHPLVLMIHGGPMGTSTEAFSVLGQLLAAEGWIVFSPNYRGSNNMGSSFQRAVINDAGEGPGQDVMAGVEAVKELGIVDEDKLAVSGWSYGGFMTTWLIAHYPGWRVAVAGAAVTDWFDWYNLADLNNWAGYGLGGSPWLNDNMENYWKQSPIAYASKIRTPTLILSNTLDPRVTVTQSYKLFYALRDNKVPVEFYAYPVPGHFPGDPVHRRDVYKRWIDWIRKHFAGD